jgi:hypothetical protein
MRDYKNGKTFCKICCKTVAKTYYTAHCRSKRHKLNSLRDAPVKTMTKKEYNHKHYLNNKDKIKKQSRRRYTPKHSIDKQCQFIKTLFI